MLILPKAPADDFLGRFREIVSDPLNILIARDEKAGFFDSNLNVYLHNENKVPIKGKYSYYEDFSRILILNRGVHEPLEEFCFQQTISRLESDQPIMLELGAYWAHYSMWLRRRFPKSINYLVEPDSNCLAAGVHNFELNELGKAKFYQAQVGLGKLEIDPFLAENNIQYLDILHSDIQGFEVEMLRGAKSTLEKQLVKYLFISTHSDELHDSVISLLLETGHIVEVESNFQTHSTSFDGFVFARSENALPIFSNFKPKGRLELPTMLPLDIHDYLTYVTNSNAVKKY